MIRAHNKNLSELNLLIYDNKFKKAFYTFLQIEASGKIIENISKELNQSENLIRYLFIKVNKHQELPTKLNYEKK